MDAVSRIRVFDGGVAIITGGASGIGRALGEALAERGADVVLADVQRELVDDVAAQMRSRGLKASAAYLDVVDHDSVKRLVDETKKERGRLDYMFNNAGIGAGGELIDHTMENWNRILDVNLKGVIHGVHVAYPVMIEQGYGHIVNTASMQGLLPAPLTASYATTKYAVVGLSKALRAEAASKGIRVSVLCPGVIRTPLLGGGVHGIPHPSISKETQREWTERYFERFRPMNATEFARKVLRQLTRNKAIIVVPSWWKVLWWLDRASPTLSIVLARRIFESAVRELTKISDAGRRAE
ncbi:MAG: SDR family oxidoreductase [Deltaproteobacteria bacterium]|nr:SDR family oxidoreductase [Deltaproteobacteria bacterium]